MDYDFTVTGWRDDNITDKTLKLFDKLIEEGFKVAIVTNAKREKVKIIEELTNGKVKVYTSMKKPNTKKIKRSFARNGFKRIRNSNNRRLVYYRH